MKKAVCLLLVLLIALLPGAAFAADSSICFIAINDDLMTLDYQAYSQSGQYYVPIDTFSRLRIYSSYHSAANTAVLTSSTRQMFFNVATGETYDDQSNYYSTSAIIRGNTVYLPLDFVCRQFGLSWSYIIGSDYGDVCRITDGSQSLSDSMFISAARPLMATWYREYTGSSVAPDSNGGVMNADSVIFLSFQGMPSVEVLNALLSYGVKATFFVTASDILAEPNLIRRAVGEGHNIGLLCSSEPELEHAEFSEALWQTAHTVTVLTASSSREFDSACESWAAGEGLVFCNYNLDGVRSGSGITAAELNSMLSGGRSPLMYLRLQSCDLTDANISSILSILTSGSVVLAASETGEG